MNETKINSRRPEGNQAIRNRRQSIRMYEMHRDGMTVKDIANIVGKSPEQVSKRIKIGERFASIKETK